MQTSIDQYNTEMLRQMKLTDVKADEIKESLRSYIQRYETVMLNKTQERYFEAYQKGLLSDLDRKSIEPIALTFLGTKDVRGFQQFFTRSKLSDEAIKRRNQEVLSESISEAEGIVNVDESDFAKKGNNSAGVARQYCGRLGKTENCQAGVFTSYASSKGYGLLDSKLYIPERWFQESYREKRKHCQIPDGLRFETKNTMALSMIQETIKSGIFEVKWIGCDAAFGCDHKFLDALPESVCYFAGTKESELVFLEKPHMLLPQMDAIKGGRPAKYPRPSIASVTVKSVALDDSIPWERRILGQGTKGPIFSDVKCIRCFSCRSLNKGYQYHGPGDEIWLYIRKYNNNEIKYFLCNAPGNTVQSVLDRLATMRWSIEQCFQECKSYLGLGHYETRTYLAWHRHMLMVMIAHTFTIYLRLELKKNSISLCL